jgi:hypothetical protein
MIAQNRAKDPTAVKIGKKAGYCAVYGKRGRDCLHNGIERA